MNVVARDSLYSKKKVSVAMRKGGVWRERERVGGKGMEGLVNRSKGEFLGTTVSRIE